MGRDDGLAYREFIGRLLNTDLVYPDDPAFAVGNLGPIVIVLGEVPVGSGARMMRIPLVDVLRRDHGRQDEPRHEYERECRLPRRMHDVAIMAAPLTAVKHSRAFPLSQAA